MHLRKLPESVDNPLDLLLPINHTSLDLMNQ